MLVYKWSHMICGVTCPMADRQVAKYGQSSSTFKKSCCLNLKKKSPRQNLTERRQSIASEFATGHSRLKVTFSTNPSPHRLLTHRNHFTNFMVIFRIYSAYRFLLFSHFKHFIFDIICSTKLALVSFPMTVKLFSLRNVILDCGYCLPQPNTAHYCP